MAVATGTALLVAAGIGAGAGLLSSRDARKAAEQQGGPHPFESTLTPYGPAQDLLNDLLGGLGGAFNTALPEFPDFVGFPGFEQIDFMGFAPELTGVLDTPDIPGASGITLRALEDIARLNKTDPFLDPAEDALTDLLEGPSDSFLLAQGNLLGGPLSEIAGGDFRGGGFGDAVANAVFEDAEEILDTQIGQIGGAAASAGRGGPEATGALINDAAGDLRQDALGALAGVRAAAFESQQGRSLAASSQIADSLAGLAGLRSSEVTTGLGLAPALEQARFFGEGLQGNLGLGVDALNQNADIFEASFDQNEAARADANLLSLLGLDLGQNQFAAGLGAQEAQALNAFNLGEFGFDVESPFLRQSQLLSLLLPIASTFGTQSGFSSGAIPATPSSLSSGLAGGLGGLQLGLALMQLFGGGNNPFSDPATFGTGQRLVDPN